MPFTTEQFFNVFAQYNGAVWPMQVILNLLAIIALFLTTWKVKYAHRAVSAILAFLWVWTGLVYHIVFFTSINDLAYVFGGFVILQGVLFFIAGSLRQKISFRPHRDIYSIVGGLLILYGLLIYPILGYFLGHVYPYSPTFGAPCPMTIFTFGLLLWTDRKLPKYLLVIPLLWSIIGFFATINWGVSEDIMLLIAGWTATAMIWYRDRVTNEFIAKFSS
jgi:hypothetical protein